MKRGMDIALSLITLLALSPLLLAAALAIALESGWPVLFRQTRVGLKGREFGMFKFRSMVKNAASLGPYFTQADDPRITCVGRFLRRTSIDELPQLINVLQGRMSLVGPRPHAVAHNEEYRRLIKGYMVRHKVLPGITGWAQVNGCRGEITTLEDMQSRVRYDLEYLRRWSLALDLKILFLTALKVLKDKQAY